MNQSERRAQLIKWSDSYYNDNVSLVPDHVFDEAQTSYFKDFNDPELRSTIGAPVVKNSPWEKALHKIPMGSLSKVSTESEFYKWYETLPSFTDVVLSEKLDGISIDLEYQEGIFVRGITRGDGIEGEDITVNVKKMKGFIPQLSNNDTVSVRGEVIITEDDFNSIVELQKLRGDKPIQNPRNGAGGKARDREGIYAGYLTIKCYDATLNFATKGQTFQWLESQSFHTPHWGVLPTAKDILHSYYSYENSKRASLDYEIDGLVLEIDDRDARERLGYKDGKPYFARAFKFSSLKVRTIDEGIEWSLGKNGTSTPVALLKAVHMGGVTVRRASLANLARFKELGLCEGDEVIVSRRGDVIPYIESISKHNGGKPFEVPTQCPECSSELKVDGKFLRCENVFCVGAVVGNLLKWVDKSGMSGTGMGSSTIEKLVERDLINTPADLYRLTVKDFLSLDGFQTRSANKMFDIIQSHKTVSLADFVGGLNLGSFGSSLAKLLVEAGYDDLKKLQSISMSKMIEIPGFGESRAIDFIEGIEKKNDVIEDLLNYVSIETKEVEMTTPTATGLAGKSFCFTGAIQKIGDDGKRLTRKDMEKLVIMNGGDTASVKKGLTYLVQADPDSQSSKTKKALSFGVEILSEAKFFEMIGE